MMSERIKFLICLLFALTVALACGRVFAADDDRFKGGSVDGYDSASYIQTDPSLLNARFRGGSFDGYDDAASTNVTIPPIEGTIFIFF